MPTETQEIELCIELNSLEVIPQNDPIYLGRIFHRPGENLTPNADESSPPVANVSYCPHFRVSMFVLQWHSSSFTNCR